MPPDQLAYHTKEIARFTAKGWIGPTYSPICAPTIMVDKRDDGTGELKMRMVVNYQALNALTIAPQFPMPSAQTVLEMIGGAAYFSTLDLEAGLHQIRMAREDRWKTAFRSVQELFEYKAMPFCLKGAPATFQANINAYLQPLLGHGVIAYLDDVLIYSSTLETHVLLLQQVLGIFLKHQFYPRLTKCKFGQRELAYLGYRVPYSSKPYTLYTDASGYATGGVLEQEGKPVGFLSQVMSPAQQKYSIYDQELLALISALDKWRLLLRGAKTTAYTDHQALTYLQRTNMQKPLRGRTARWLDFLAEFPDLTISYLQGAHNKCHASKALSQKPAGLLQPLLVPSRRWSHVSLDFITDLPLTPRGDDCILVIVDSLIKMAHIIPTKKSASTADTIELLADRLIRYHGFPDVLISDRDPRFQSQLWQQHCQRFHIKRAMSSPYHPQSDGQTERVNRTLEQMLRTYIQTDEREWERLLPALELAYNTTSHSSTELSPFEVMIGQNPVTAADLNVVGNIAPTLTPPMTELFQQLCDRAQSHIIKAKWQQKRYADAHRRDAQYNPGDRVWISSRNLPGLNQCSKFEPRFLGPFAVLERIGQVAYRIELPPTYTCHNAFHVSQLVPDRPRDPQMKSKEAAVWRLPVTGPDGTPTDIYEVDYILDQRGSDEDIQYLVKWRGAPEDRATWEPAANLTNCPALLRAWRRHIRRARKAQRGPQDVAPGSGNTTSALASSPTFFSPGREGVERHPPAAAPLVAEDSLKEPARHISLGNTSDSEADLRRFFSTPVEQALRPLGLGEETA
ncbi:uncharacterized protein EMH_0019520 [Eimeria mitis]|uniref:Uncharacterized protein n=1 Tax=Eimeria mitis TaxID=44415 RepID=U6K8D1_9EIME|nr:uncharacterized protein EMH_0019520 [Eimeria mitis]CDJ34265.1 hypothetical protein EMH_0019520 [Eimeria mitis]